MKKTLLSVLAIAMTLSLLAGCKSDGNGNGADAGKSNGGAITVISREDGSGTRGAFVELFGILEKGEDGSKTDKTTIEAVIANKTDVMLTGVANDENAIGYVSLGSLSATVKALSIDGIEATSENVKNGSYKISRPFMIATNGEADGLKKDFIDFILSKEGQAVVATGYIAIDENAPAYAGTKQSGKLVVAGSSSVTPIMEKLKEAYAAINPDVNIEIQQTDSTAGMEGAISGTCDIGMASRELKDSELEKLTGIAIANDGIAVIVNTKSSITNATPSQIKDIFTGTATKWSELS